MKVVLFCGGMGMRLREVSDTIPKPLVTAGSRPVLFNLMKYYAHFGHKDFILCLGHRAEAIKEYFINYDERLSNDFVLSAGGRSIELLNRDIDDWRITFVDTGQQANIGERLWAVKSLLAGEEMFMANYADGLTDLPLDSYLDEFTAMSKVASFISVPVPQAFHVVRMGEAPLVSDIECIDGSSIRINGGFFIFRPEIFDYMRPGEELVEAPFTRLIEKGELVAHEYNGFWKCMDTFKDKRAFEELEASGTPPWQVWRRG